MKNFEAKIKAEDGIYECAFRLQMDEDGDIYYLVNVKTPQQRLLEVTMEMIEYNEAFQITYIDDPEANLYHIEAELNDLIYHQDEE